jgi:aryl-alcohol dehydrogenase-like predicted oxidoreductase
VQTHETPYSYLHRSRYRDGIVLPHLRFVIAKRPIANAPWRFNECPKGDYAEEYWWRWKTMDIETRGLNWQAVALRFTAFTPGVSSCIVGTTQLNHVQENIEYIESGPLNDDHRVLIRKAFRDNDPGWWVGQV